ncbi:hypothetical protein CRD59_06360 [Bifidobacterium xylocopae]|uniref:UvrD-like helicase ATP-binding domain-containing protein n=2 Tax=Bifidobacterium xylocopae TaxID=2493119 RepID=A0A366KC70_9BIFI|nr:hypothetical protein CRD59_06360 [Bifidobacterium xylocopae]
MDQALEAVRHLITGGLAREDGKSAGALCLAGPPRSGKTTLALEALLAGLAEFGDGGAAMVVSGRHAADQISRAVIARRGASGQTRPVGTVQALAFRFLSRHCEGEPGRPLPRLLNGAEQDALLRQVMASHIAHVQAGDDCASCRLLERYFAAETGWSGILTKPGQGNPDLADRVDDDFIAQLRDTMARMTELGLDPLDQDPVLDALARQGLDLDARDRLNLQWRLAFALWREYLEAVDKGYPGEYRLDPSKLMVAGRQAVEEGLDLDLPRLLVVDDWQDLTMAGMGFVQALEGRGVRLLLVGNPDESVQAFRGSYPEFLSVRMGRVAPDGPVDGAIGEAALAEALLPPDLGCLGAVCLTLPYRPITQPSAPAGGEDDTNVAGEGGDKASAGAQESPDAAPTAADATSSPYASYADLLAARVSLSIRSEEHDDRAVRDRPGKMPDHPGAMPIAPLPADGGLPADGSVSTRLFHTADQEEDDLVWQVKHEFLSGRWDWNDMAVIAHDNATVRSIGLRLRAEGVPVRYSSIARPLKDEPVARGLFALINLAQARIGHAPAIRTLAAVDQARWLAEQLRTLLSSPLLGAPLPGGGAMRPVRAGRIASLLDVLVSLTRVGSRDNADGQAAAIVQDGHAAGSPLPSGPGQTPDSPLSPNPSEPAGPAGTAVADRTGGADDPCAGVEGPVAVLADMQEAWASYAVARRRELDETQAASGISVDDSLVTPPAGTEAPVPERALSAEAVCLLLLLDGGTAGPDPVGERSSLRDSIIGALAAIASSRHRDPDLTALSRALALVDGTGEAFDRLQVQTAEPVYALWEAWQAAGVADRWQNESLEASEEGERVNDRLDAVMRLFQFADSSQTFDNINDFMAQVEGMQIEADSLAHVGPIEHAVSLTTPAGASGLAASWPLVWLPALQEGVWPNLAPRGTLFGAEDLADLILHGRIGRSDPGAAGGHDPRLASTLYTEEKGLLMALTRARRQLRLSAVWNDDTVPSEFLYGFLPERFVRVEDMSQADFTPVGGQEGAAGLFSGLEVGPRGLVAAARSILVRQGLQPTAHGSADGGVEGADGGDGPVDAAAASDAAATLRLLADQGMEEADPANWPFLYARRSPEEEDCPDGAQGGTALAGAAPGADAVRVDAAGGGLADDRRKRPVPSAAAANGQGKLALTEENSVTLSPSAVDAIWRCPLEWVMGNQFSGPQAGSVAMDFGSLIHQVAQVAADRGLDMPDRGRLGSDAVGDGELIASTTNQMMDIYHQLAAAFPVFPAPEDAYDVRRRDAQVRGTLTNIASYFVNSAKSDYAQDHKPKIMVGELLGSEQEQQFRASFTPGDFAGVWNASFSDRQLGQEGFFALASALVGGFPQALRPDTAITLSGRIDRLERRDIAGRTCNRLVDYKTGSRGHTGPAVFNDLQLVCYQLGLAYQREDDVAEGVAPDRTGPRMPSGDPVSQAVLFDVSAHPAPAWVRTAEASYQPALFRDGRLNGDFAPRYYLKELQRIARPDPLPSDPPLGVSGEIWDFIKQMQHSQAVWALTMIARVLFAAGVKLSAGRQDAVFDADRCHNKGRDGRCPAWRSLAGSVMEDQR